MKKNALTITLFVSVSRALLFGITMSLLFLGGLQGTARADEAPPLPLHGIEGYGGIAITYTAYLTNPAQDGAIFGKPSIGLGAVFTDHNDYLGIGTITETLWDRLELGYGFNALHLSDLQDDIQAETGIKIGDDTVYLHNFNARLALVK